INGNLENPVEDLFFYELKEKDEKGYQELLFFRDYIGANNEIFTVKKIFGFYDKEYLITAKIVIENKDNKKYLVLNSSNNSYAFSFGPQLGPEFKQLKKRYNYRDFGYFNGKKLIKKNKSVEVTDVPNWAAIYSKYFTVILTKTSLTEKLVIQREGPKPNLEVSNEMFMVSGKINDYKVDETYKIYLGPKVKSYLGNYNKAEQNKFGISNAKFNEITNGFFLIDILVNFLKISLDWMYSWMNNYGVAIILLTILIKLLIFPITRKSYQSSSEMQKISPKINEIKEKYKNDPQRMNQEVAKLYKESGINPMKGCLPMVIQMPIFIAMYQLCLNHFALQGKPFMLWINDLSLADSVYSFDFETSIGFLQGFDAIRILPVLFVATQIISTKIMQGKSAPANGSMKFMIYGLPLVFFFILYSAPSGLFVYWITSNIITFLQQILINEIKKRKKESPKKNQNAKKIVNKGKLVAKKKR
ncbi:MAG: membrane protein insertase YidC, partial [Spirochaetales bacterium]|nr:membrane protein insertase YidC [Spirochaetales bacterium]